jgi:ankyrin repeat protein
VVQLKDCLPKGVDSLHYNMRESLGVVSSDAILHTECMEDDYTDLHRAVKDGDANTVKQLLAEGKDSNAQTPRHKCTPSHLAAHYGHETVLWLLVKTGKVYFNARDVKGHTPLHHAVLGQSERTAKLLLRNGADPTVIDLSGYTPYTLALKLGCTALETLFNESFSIIPPPYGPKGRVPRPQEPGNKKSQVCKEFRGLILSLKGVDSYEGLNPHEGLKVSRPTVWDMLYGAGLPKTKDITWINLPANNVSIP